jgi:hypothetical protein
VGGVSEAEPGGENRNAGALNRRTHLEPISESTLSRPKSAGRSTSRNRTSGPRGFTSAGREYLVNAVLFIAGSPGRWGEPITLES